MLLRRATVADIPHIGQLFYTTITEINSADYSPAQIEAWRGGWQNTAGWQAKLEAQYFLVAEAPDGLAGFASLCPDGYLDFLFVSAQHQRQGVARELLQALLQQAAALGLSTVHTDASRTARPFFAHHGFVVERAQQPVIRGVEIPNFRMVKPLTFLHSDNQL
ncbi:GNAT family N-acetyltransferase [Hymenobacter taeanensis]|uniref:GNAT family N-acetyltransferase n=1 Tax=Hymenobacter taeanensis TaxID=2735321 RepID=A0A6M6BJX9_9BACT|nr:MULTISPECIES: GNAT family N-acetyltransferase [Hymenobacter]QJX48396.1 GNAT family N-acetyltransferase [Hymenobacter taeanensis]UOQ82111.1 GNAT family N-acetyltransferase [Hymenobacter sp. 5414T-23]